MLKTALTKNPSTVVTNTGHQFLHHGSGTIFIRHVGLLHLHGGMVSIQSCLSTGQGSVRLGHI